MGDKKAKGMDELVNYKPARVMYARPSEQWRENIPSSTAKPIGADA